MVIILAGCDGTGKSTCFKLLKEQMPGNFIKESYTDDVHVKHIRAEFLISKLNDKDLTVYDRATILDDLVYEYVMNNNRSYLYNLLGVPTIKEALRKSLIIYFELDEETLKNRLEIRKDDYIKAYQINKIKRFYEETFKNLNLNIRRLNVTGLSPEQVYNKVRRIIENEEFENC